jgi:hypothetical protein
MQEDILEMRVDRTKISVSNSFDNTEEKEYWHSRTPQERLAHMERLRRINYGEEATKPMQKVLKIGQIDWK